MKIRQGRAEDLSNIFMMGFDAWGEDMSEEDYLELCHSSTKYPQGQWWVLDEEGEAVASLIVYQQGFNLPEGCWGIGSVATPPPLRRQGHAAKLINHVIDSAHAAEARGLYLFTGVGTAYYGKFGFEVVEAEQPDPESPCMVLALQDEAELKQQVPYFF